MSSLTSNIKSSDKRTIYAVLITIVVLGLCIGCMSAYYNNRIDNLNNDIAFQNSQLSTKYSSEKSIQVNIFSPLKNTKIASSLVVIGQVPGSWSFEGSFPIKIQNAAGLVVASGTGNLIGDWMTDDLVTFTAELSWTSVESGNGTIIFEKDNHSGLEKNDDRLSIPVRF